MINNNKIKKDIKPIDNIRLHTILNNMVLNNRLSDTEMLQILSKAGLHKNIQSGKWVDEKGCMYSL